MEICLHNHSPMKQPLPQGLPSFSLLDPGWNSDFHNADWLLQINMQKEI